MIIFVVEIVEILFCYKLMIVRRKFEHSKGFFVILFTISVNVGHMIKYGIIKKLSAFNITRRVTDSANLLNSDLSKIDKWALQWKMSFNPDPTKQAQEIIFSRKTSYRNHPGLMFNNVIVNVTTIHKHLGMIFDSKLRFDEHLKSVLKKNK